MADSSPKIPSGIDTWRRIDFGSLMLNSLINQSSTISDDPEVVFISNAKKSRDLTSIVILDFKK